MKTNLIKLLCIVLVLMTNMTFAQSFTNFSVSSTGNHLLDNNIQAIAIDQSGNKWVGTNYGVSVFNSADTWLYNDTSVDDLTEDHDFIRDIDVDAQGNVWIANFISYKFKGSLIKFDGTNWTTYLYDTLPGGAPANIVNPNIFKLAIDHNDNVWLATGGGISKFNSTSSTFTNYTDITSGLPNNVVQCVAIDNNNVKWFGTDNGLVKYDDVTWTLYTTANGLVDNNIISIAVDANNNVWAGSGDFGVSKFDGGTWTTYSTTDGLISDGVNYIACGADGSIWLGSYMGISRFKNSVWTTFTSADGLPSDCILFITPEDNTTMWIGTVCEGGFSKCVYTSGMDEVNPTIAFNVFPNPAKEFVTISIEKSNTNRTVELLNVMNQKIDEYNLTKGEESLSLSVDFLSKGIYFLKIENDCRKLIIQ